MPFVHPLLLGGLLLVGVPVLIHLIMRQKPKHLLFPAFRFLVQRARTNQRKMQLRHLILLLLRISLIVLICLALARFQVTPSIGESLNIGSGQPVAVALVFDTSASMEYRVGEKSRLDDARRRALELLDDLPESSRVAVFDSAEPISGDFLPSLGMVRERVSGLQIRYANGPVTNALVQAYRLLATLDDEDHTGEPMPRFVYVFSDRTQDSWDAGRNAQLIEMRERMNPPKVQGVFVDVGVEKPTNLAILDLDLPRQIVPANDRAIVRARVQATGRDYDTEIVCRFDDKTVERKPLKVRAGLGETIPFETRDTKVGLHRVEVSLATPDQLPFSAGRFATFEVRGPRLVLAITDNPGDAKTRGDADIWKLALDKGGAFHCDVMSTRDAGNLGPKDLSKYQVVCLLNVADPSRDLWEKLKQYVEEGGGLAILPGGAELRTAAYQDEEDKQAVNELMPGILERVIDDDKGMPWKESTYRHPVMAPFREWGQAANVDFIKLPPRAVRYWSVKPRREENVIVSYADAETRPALLERLFDRKKVRGRVLLFTTPMDGRTLTADTDRRWNNYLETSFYFVLANKTIGYLAGDAEAAAFNFACGQTVTIALPPTPRFPSYILEGPALGGGAVTIARTATQSEIRVVQAVAPGQFTLTGGERQWVTGFSMNVPPGEYNLARVPGEQIEAVLGKGALLPVDHNVNLKDALQEHWSGPVELFPWLMILLLLILAVENLLANRFYKGPGSEFKVSGSEFKVSSSEVRVPSSQQPE
ncbi:MAG: VWA domain-containing protein [Gemmataceae bacterium]|nr:VWA domain-containing protein [Gemmataceae bacterium]